MWSIPSSSERVKRAARSDVPVYSEIFIKLFQRIQRESLVFEAYYSRKPKYLFLGAIEFKIVENEYEKVKYYLYSPKEFSELEVVHRPDITSTVEVS